MYFRMSGDYSFMVRWFIHSFRRGIAFLLSANSWMLDEVLQILEILKSLHLANMELRLADILWDFVLDSQSLGFFVCLFLFIFRYAVCRIFIPWPKIEPGLQQWKGQVLTSGLPGNSLRVSNGIAFSSINFEKYNAELRGFNFKAKDETKITKWKFLRLFQVNKS